MIRKSQGTQNPVQFDPEIEATAHTRGGRRRRQQVQREMEEPPRILQDLAKPNAADIGSSIIRPPVQANTFELKPALLQVFQNNKFEGDDDEDPIEHVNEFMERCNTLKFNNVQEDAIRLRLLLFSLQGRAKQWLKSQPFNNSTTWDALQSVFLLKFFPSELTTCLQNEIRTF